MLGTRIETEPSGFWRIVYWDWDLAELWSDFVALVTYYLNQYGFESALVIALIIVAVALSWRVTRNAMATIVETVVRSTVRVTIYTVPIALFFGGRYLFGRSLVYGRWLSRTISDLLR